jgi:FkbM family methyltransferase
MSMGGLMRKLPNSRLWLWAAIAVFALPGAVLSFHPQLILLIYPGIRVTSPYCSRWQAFLDFHALERQKAGEKAFGQGMRRLQSDGALELWETRDGPYWIPKGSHETLAVLVAQQKRDIYGTVVKGETVIDCGAHVGTYARHALRSGAGKLVAVEPSPDASECLRRNFDREIADGRLILVKKGIWDREQDLTFYVNGNGDAANSFIVHGKASKALTVPVTSVDRLVEELALGRVGMIKADVKGATARLLAGAQATLKRDRPRLALSTEEPPEDPATLTSLVSKLQPAYQAKCGPCLAADGQIRTDVMFYQ